MGWTLFLGAMSKAISIDGRMIPRHHEARRLTTEVSVTVLCSNQMRAKRAEVISLKNVASDF